MAAAGRGAARGGHVHGAQAAGHGASGDAVVTRVMVVTRVVALGRVMVVSRIMVVGRVVLVMASRMPEGDPATPLPNCDPTHHDEPTYLLTAMPLLTATAPPHPLAALLTR